MDVLNLENCRLAIRRIRKFASLVASRDSGDFREKEAMLHRSIREQNRTDYWEKGKKKFDLVSNSGG